MRKQFLCILLLLAVTAMAEERTPAEAAEIAARFTNSQPSLRRAHRTDRKAGNMRLAHTERKINSEQAAYYVFNQENNAGYVIVSGDDLAPDVLVYGEQGQFDIATINPNFRFWLRYLQEQMSVINEENAAPKKQPMVTPIAPLLVNKEGKEITWYQEKPYNNLCPIDKLDNTRSLTGCVATAAAQLMYKWRYPQTGMDKFSYVWENCLDEDCYYTDTTTLSLDFSQITFDWDNMLPAYEDVSSTTAQKNAVATLMYACGVSCEMAYGGDTFGGSGAWTDDMGYALKKYFGYNVDKFISTYSRSAYSRAKRKPIADIPAEWSVSDTTFTRYFNTELEEGRPVLMGGEDSDSGHEFICDGRNSSGYFHINWGWEGYGNNYCILSFLKPDGRNYVFSVELDALLGVRPAVIDTVHVTGVRVTPNTVNLRIKEKGALSASVSPADATVKKVNWKSSEPGVATVSATGIVEGVKAGTSVITATSLDGGYTSQCVVSVSHDTIDVLPCDDYSYTFSKNKLISTGANSLGNYTWNLTLGAGKVQQWDVNGRGYQIGSAKNTAGTVSFSTTNTAECVLSEVVVNASVASKASGSLSVYIGGKQIGTTQSLSSSATDYRFVNTNKEQGNLEIRASKLTKAFFILSIDVESEVELPTAIEEVQTQNQDRKAVSKVLIDGHVYILRDGHMYDMMGQEVK